GVAPASPQVAYRALLERARGCEPADRGGVDGIGPRHIGLRLACSKALERFLALMRRHLARASEANAVLLRPSPVLARISSRSNSAPISSSTLSRSRVCQPIKAGDDQHIAWVEPHDCLGQIGPVRPGAPPPSPEDLRATGGP